MTYDAWTFLVRTDKSGRWLPVAETMCNDAASYLTEKIGNAGEGDYVGVTRAAVFRFAFEGRLPIIVSLPDGATDAEGRPMEPGLWDVEVQGGTKREFEYYHERWLNQPLPEINGIEGAWVKRDDDRRQLEAQKGASVLTNSPSGPFFPFGLAHTPCSLPSSFPPKSIVGIRIEALDAFVAEGKKDDKSEPVKAEWTDVTITLLPDEHDVQIQVYNKSLPVTSYEALGFEDQKRNRPIKSWETFKRLAEAKSQRIDLPPQKDRKSWERETGDTDRMAIQNRIEEINRKLRAALDRLGYVIPDKPAPLVFDDENQCYEPTPGFRITVSGRY